MIFLHLLRQAHDFKLERVVEIVDEREVQSLLQVEAATPEAVATEHAKDRHAECGPSNREQDRYHTSDPARTATGVRSFSTA